MERAPVAHPPLQRPADAVVGEGVGVGHLQMAQQRHRLHGGVALEDRQQHRLPDRLERIGNGAPALGLALRRQARIGVDPASGALAEPGPGGGGALAVTMAVLHVRSHLLVGDGFARHGGDLRLATEIPVVPARSSQHLRPIPERWRAIKITYFERRRMAAVRQELDQEYQAAIAAPAPASARSSPADLSSRSRT